MPTNFPNYNPGDLILDTHVELAYSAINAIESGSVFYVEDTASGTDNYTGTVTPAVSSYTSGLMIHFKPATSNTGTATIDLNSVGSNIIKRKSGSDLSTGDMLVGGIYTLLYDGTNFILLNPEAPSSTAVTDHINDTDDAHDANAISFSPTGNIAATNVQTAIAELDSEKAASSHSHAASDITSGELPVTRGGTGLGTVAANKLIGTGGSTDAVQAINIGTGLSLSSGTLSATGGGGSGDADSWLTWTW